jgi:predicted RNA-binding protein YlqC (UPF0109 family)
MAEFADAEFLEYVVKSLVDEPEKVAVDRKVDEMGVLLTLKVSAPDMGKIIGRAGNTAKSIRSLLRVVGMKNNARVNLKIEEPEGGKGPRASRPVETVSEEGVGNDRLADMDKAIEDLKL